LRIDLAGDPSLRDLALAVREVALTAFSHQDLPFEKLVEELKPERSLARTPLFQVLFVLQNAPQERLDLPGLSLAPMGAGLEAAKFALALALTHTPAGLAGSWSYDRQLFDRTTIMRLAGRFERLLEAMAEEDELRLSE